MPRFTAHPRTPATRLLDPEAGDPRQPRSRRRTREESPEDLPMDPYAGLQEHLRDQAIVTANETLTDIQRTQTKTRDKTGRIRRGKFIGAVLGLRYQGFTPKETAEILGCSWQQVTYALTVIRKDADLDAQVSRLNNIAVPLAMDNAIRGVMNGDKEYTLKVLDGAGVFRTHKSIQGELKQTITSLSVVLAMPPHLIGQSLPLPRAGGIVGAPTIPTGLPAAQCLEGVVVESAPLDLVPRDADVIRLTLDPDVTD